MRENFLDLSGKIDDATTQLLGTIADVAEYVRVPFFVVGATARDIILMHGYGLRTIRATRDIDLGVEVSEWQEYETLKEALLSTGVFAASMEHQRVTYRDMLQIDLVPFGPIAQPGNAFSWPSDKETQMNTLGFEEAYRSSMTIRLKSDPVLEIKFASLAGLAAMKIISWNDNYPFRRKDAEDLSIIMQTYLDAGNRDRLYEEEDDLLETDDFDYVLAGSRLLGRDIGEILSPETRAAVLEILGRETGTQERYRLVEDMLTADRPVTASDGFDGRLQLVEALKAGILDKE
ncbi:MAG: nucleotidyl transferase AbiEii/AbiGii toxin family protein [Thermodesulfobacteriota bacterium]|nr:nucleotidyl transferase AbiEii/AbiGii toxin family protein [Thermodesulfobacteriota bacterium]